MRQDRRRIYNNPFIYIMIYLYFIILLNAPVFKLIIISLAYYKYTI